MKKNLLKKCAVIGAVLLMGSLTACGGSKPAGSSAASTAAASTPAVASSAVASSAPASSAVASSAAPSSAAAVASSSQAASSSAASTAGGAGECGKYKFTIPEGFELKIGDFMDENDTRVFSIKKSDFAYFDFKTEEGDNMMKQYEYNKKTYTNEQTDAKGTYNNISWTGFQYSDGFGGYGFEAYAKVGGQDIRVSSAGFKFDSDEAKLVLGSIALK